MMNLGPAEPMTYEEVFVDNLRFFDSNRISLRQLHYAKNNLTMQTMIEESSRSLVIKLETFLLSTHKLEVLKYEHVPVTWWDHFKIRWFPMWMLRRYPAKRRKIETFLHHFWICPHIDMETDNEPHVRFLLNKEKKVE